MPNTVEVFFASHDGQTRRIVDEICRHLREAGVVVGDHEIGDDRPMPVPERADVVVLAAPIRYGFPLRIADRFLRRITPYIDQRRFALILVNLTARRPGRTTPAGNAYLRRWIARRRIDPAIARAVAGRLDYPSYPWYVRAMMRLIMTLSRGPTDPTVSIEYTDWREVEDLAGEIAALARHAAESVRNGSSSAPERRIRGPDGPKNTEEY